MKARSTQNQSSSVRYLGKNTSGSHFLFVLYLVWSLSVQYFNILSNGPSGKMSPGGLTDTPFSLSWPVNSPYSPFWVLSGFLSLRSLHFFCLWQFGHSLASHSMLHISYTTNLRLIRISWPPRLHLILLFLNLVNAQSWLVNEIKDFPFLFSHPQPADLRILSWGFPPVRGCLQVAEYKTAQLEVCTFHSSNPAHPSEPSNPRAPKVVRQKAVPEKE